MANFGKLKPAKKRNALGGAKPPTEESGNLDAPELAPKAFEEPIAPRVVKKSKPNADEKIDGRSLRKTGRVELLSVRVTPEAANRFKSLAKENGLKMNEAMERAIVLLEKELTVN